MKQVYAIVLTRVEKGYAVFVPDLSISTQGKDLTDAVDMARDAICMSICYEQDQGRAVSPPRDLEDIKIEPNQKIALVDIDLDAYRRARSNRVIRKNLTIPAWLNEEAEKAGVNFSQILQDGLKKHLNIQKQP
ncbi:MAG: HicB family protein [Syntrophomonadaceae bacterium]|nr:HicB family protein [Syntrophomonadaceae bacterium]